jgi:hypothetical protein
MLTYDLEGDTIWPIIILYISSSYFGAIVGLEFRASGLLGRCSKS